MITPGGTAKTFKNHPLREVLAIKHLHVVCSLKSTLPATTKIRVHCSLLLFIGEELPDLLGFSFEGELFKALEYAGYLLVHPLVHIEKGTHGGYQVLID
jgi:hypothetical protein